MNDENRTKGQLIEELIHLRRRITELEKAEREHEQAQEALQKLSKLQSVILGNSTVGIALVCDRVFEWVNSKMAELYDIPVDKFQGASTRIVYPDDEAYQKLTNEAYSMIAQGKEAVFETRMCKRDGSLFWCRVKGKALNPSRLEEGTVWTSEDISEQKQKSEALLMTQFAMDRAPDSILWVDEEGRIAYANESACTSMGYTRDELQARTVFDIDPDFSRRKWEQHKKDMQRQGSMLFQGRHFTKDGHIFPVEISSNYFEFGGRWFACAFDRDITDRKRAEQALQRERDLLQSVMDGAGKSNLVYLDRDFNFVRVNETYAAGCRYRPEEMIGKNHFVLYPNAENEAIFTSVRDTGQTFEVRDRPFKFPDQPERGITYWDWTLNPIKDPDGRVTGLVFSLYDTTERKRAEEERLALERRLRQAQKTESIGRMADAIAHLFNNKLGAVMGCLELALVDLSPDSKARRFLDRAMTASREAVKIVRELMLTHLGYVVEKRAPLDLGQLTREAVTELMAMLPDQIQLRTARIPAHGPKINASRSQIMLIINSVVTNAMEAIGDNKGEITLSICVKPASEFRNLRYYRADWDLKDDSYACLSVSDTGCGLDESLYDRIFEPFYTTKLVGRGLGLAVVHGIVSAHEGAITFESQPGQGTTFHILFPMTGSD